MKKKHVQLTAEQEKLLLEMVDKGHLSGRKYKRALALLELNRGKTYKAVSETVNVSPLTLSRLAKKFKGQALECINDKPRLGCPVMIGGDAMAKVTALACSTPPDGYGQWSLRLLAEKAVQLEYVEEISHTKVGQILKKRTQATSESSMVHRQDEQPIYQSDGSDSRFVRKSV